MKISLLLLILIFALIQCKNDSVRSNKTLNSLKVDSFFNAGFSSIHVTNHDQVFLSKKQNDFIFILSYSSGIYIGMKSGYTGDLDLNEYKLDQFKKWYIDNRKKIDWVKIKKAIEILNSNKFNNENFKKLTDLKVK